MKNHERIYANRRPELPKGFTYLGARFAVLCNCNKQIDIPPEGLQKRVPGALKCSRCGRYPYIDLRQHNEVKDER